MSGKDLCSILIITNSQTFKYSCIFPRIHSKNKIIDLPPHTQSIKNDCLMFLKHFISVINEFTYFLDLMYITSVGFRLHSIAYS